MVNSDIWYIPSVVHLHHRFVWYSLMHGTPSCMVHSHAWYIPSVVHLCHKFVCSIPSCTVHPPAWYTLIHGTSLLWYTFVIGWCGIPSCTWYTLCIVHFYVLYSIMCSTPSCMVHPLLSALLCVVFHHVEYSLLHGLPVSQVCVQ